MILKSFEIYEILVPVWRILLLGSAAFSIFRVIQDETDFDQAIIGMVFAMIGIYFFLNGFRLLDMVSELLVSFMEAHIDRHSLNEKLLQAIKATQANRGGTLPSQGQFFSDVWKAGVWGVISSIVDFIFMGADVLLETSAKVFFNLIVVLFPIACGLFPIFPRFLFNLLLYSFEVILWRPILVVVHEMISVVAREYVISGDDFGIRILMIEVIAIVLIFSIPTMTNKIISSAMSGDFGSSSGVTKAGHRIYRSVSGMIGGVLG